LNVIFATDLFSALITSLCLLLKVRVTTTNPLTPSSSVIHARKCSKLHTIARLRLLLTLAIIMRKIARRSNHVTSKLLHQRSNAENVDRCFKSSALVLRTEIIVRVLSVIFATDLFSALITSLCLLLKVLVTTTSPVTHNLNAINARKCLKLPSIARVKTRLMLAIIMRKIVRGSEYVTIRLLTAQKLVRISLRRGLRSKM
jgi:hypothetical protein